MKIILRNNPFENNSSNKWGTNDKNTPDKMETSNLNAIYRYSEITNSNNYRIQNGLISQKSRNRNPHRNSISKSPSYTIISNVSRSSPYRRITKNPEQLRRIPLIHSPPRKIKNGNRFTTNNENSGSKLNPIQIRINGSETSDDITEKITLNHDNDQSIIITSDDFTQTISNDIQSIPISISHDTNKSQSKVNLIETSTQTNEITLIPKKNAIIQTTEITPVVLFDTYTQMTSRISNTDQEKSENQNCILTIDAIVQTYEDEEKKTA